MRINTEVSDTFICIKCQTIQVLQRGRLPDGCPCGYTITTKLKIEDVFDISLTIADRIFLKGLDSLKEF